MKKKFLLLPIIGSFLLTGCKINLFGKTIYLFEKPKESEPSEVVIDDVTPEDQKQHCVSVSITPSTRFILKVGEVKTLTVEYDPKPTEPSEIDTDFKLVGDHIEYSVTSQTDKKINLSIKGKSSGYSELIATNKYNTTLSKTFKIDVVDYNEDTSYLWRFDKDVDLAPFVDKKVGAAYLGKLEWEFSRSNLVKASNDTGALKFGLSKQPETELTFTAHTKRTVSHISIETASANSQSVMNVTVGETKYIEDATCSKLGSSNEFDILTSSPSVQKTSGDIVINVKTPKYEQSQDVSGSGYKAPGAFYLKSITILFEDEPTFAFEKKYDFKVMYNDEEDTVLHPLTTTEKAVKIEDENFEISLGNVRKEDTDKLNIEGYALSNGLIDIKLKRSDEVISRVEFKYNNGGKTRSYSILMTRVNGEPFANPNIKGDENGLLVSYVLEDNVNYVRLSNNGGFVGLDYLEVKTRTGVIGTIDKLEAPTEFEPNKKEYGKNDEFVPDGMHDVHIKFKEEGVRDAYLPASMLEWFDGVSYETNPATATKKLAVGTTSVVGVYRDAYTIEYEGITVTEDVINVERVDSLDQITNDGKYYITCPNVNLILMGSTKNTDIFKAVGSKSYPELSFGEEIEFNQLLENEYISIHPQSDGTYIFETRTGANFGLTDTGGGDGSAASGRPFTKFTISIGENGVISASVTANTADGDVTMYLGCNESSKLFKLYSTDKANVVLYKVVA